MLIFEAANGNSRDPMTCHHTSAHMDHQRNWDMLICHRQISAGKLADLAHSNYMVGFGKVSTSSGRDQTLLLVGFPS